MADKELSLKITVASVKEHIVCPVCMHNMRSTHMTPCGHRYCESCIRECINRRHRCPCCNATVSEDELIKDPQFDNLIETIHREEEQAEKSYFDTLIHQATVPASTTDGPSSSDDHDFRKHFSPIEQVLKGHLKTSLISHEKFYQDLQRDVMRRQNDIECQLKQSLETLSGSPNDERDRQVQEARDDCERRKKALEEEMSRCARLVADAYDKYLTEHIPDLHILPVTVSLSLLGKGIQITDIQLKPQDTIDDIKRILTEEMAKRHDHIVEFADNVRFLSFSPFARRTLYEKNRMASDIFDHGAACPDVTVLPSNCRPVIQCSVRPGSDIALYGTVKCESDVPKQCFMTTFRVGETKPMDYFSCKNCKLNWVCRPCMESCHRDHEVVPYILNHLPTWACCYCPKKKKCILQQ